MISPLATWWEANFCIISEQCLRRVLFVSEILFNFVVLLDK